MWCYVVNIDKFKQLKIAIGVNIKNPKELLFVIKIPHRIINILKNIVLSIPDKESYEIRFETENIIQVNNYVYTYNNENNVKELKQSRWYFHTKETCTKIMRNSGYISKLEIGTVLVVFSSME